MQALIRASPGPRCPRRPAPFGTADHVLCGLAGPAGGRAAADRSVEPYGRLGAAFGNGAAGQPPGPVGQLPEAGFGHVHAVGLKRPRVAMTAEAAAVRATAKRGAVVSTSSGVGGLAGDPRPPVYGAAKRAVSRLTASAATRYGPESIRVSAIAPGTTLNEAP